MGFEREEFVGEGEMTHFSLVLSACINFTANRKSPPVLLATISK